MAIYTIDARTKGTILPGWVLTPQQRVVIRWLSGLWSSNPGVQPSMHDANGNPNYKAKGGYLLPGSNEGCLVACVGNPAIRKYFVGNYGIVGGTAGQLWVACNDDWNAIFGAGYTDNAGSVQIEVLNVLSFLKSLTTDEDVSEFFTAIGSQLKAHEVAKISSLVGDAYQELVFGPADAAIREMQFTAEAEGQEDTP